MHGDASAGTGYGVIAQADASSPVSAALRIVPQDDDPSTTAEGDIWYNSGTDELRAKVDAVDVSLWATLDGMTRTWVDDGSASNNNSAAYTTLATCTMSGPLFTPQHVGVVIIQASAEFGAAGGSVHTTLDLRLYDTTAGAAIWTRTIDMPAAVAGPIYDRPWSVIQAYTLPSTGARTLELQFKKTGGAGTGVQARDAGIFVLGIF